MASTFQFPKIVSRTLDPSGKSLLSVIAMHDRQITDADLNLIQQLQDYKSDKLIVDHGVTSGGLTQAPMQFDTNNSNVFFIPAFDVLFNGEVVTIQGQNSTDLTLNRVELPLPPSFVAGTEDARLYVVFLELWYQALNPINGVGYYQDPLILGPKYFYPYGGIMPWPSNAKIMPDDSVDPAQGLFTTERAQIQWRINVQRVALDYDFTQGEFGFYYPTARVPDATYISTITDVKNSGLGAVQGDPGQIVYGQARQAPPTLGVSPLVGIDIYKFVGMENGDTGLWRCGNGIVTNSLDTMDGYSYAMPVAVVFQRNQSNFAIGTLSDNIFGCGDSTASGHSGTLSSAPSGSFPISGRLDSKLADQIFPSDVVDTRSTVSLTGYDMDDLMRKGFVDLIMGNTQIAISRGESPGNSLNALGSQLDYYISIGQVSVPNTILLGAFDGFSNGFSSDQRTFFSTTRVTINDSRRVGNLGKPWAVDDKITISLPSSSSGVISSINVTAMVKTTQTLVVDPQDKTKNVVVVSLVPTSLLLGQISPLTVAGQTAIVGIAKDLSKTVFNPGSEDLYLTIGVTYYPAGNTVNVNTRKIPSSIKGGLLTDSGKTLPIFGISEYQIQTQQISNGSQIWAINPEYSDLIFGTRIQVQKQGSSGNVQTFNNIQQTTFVIDCTGLNGHLNGLYVINAWNSTTPSKSLSILSNMMTTDIQGKIQNVVALEGAIDPASTIVFLMLVKDTAQLAYNAPVKGITQIEETVLFGTYAGNLAFKIDSRVIVNPLSVSYNPISKVSTVVLGADGCQIKGISGDDNHRFIWLEDGSGNFSAQKINSVSFNNGTAVITVPQDLTSGTKSSFFFVGSILPALSSQSSMILQLQYIPYQGEGILNRKYDIIHSEDDALITTNGTGSAPVIGLADVYPYNRELPIATTLPSLTNNWNDSDLTNTPMSTFLDSNFVAMRQNNVEHTFLVPLHTNDFIPPINKDIRRSVQFITAGGRGFKQAIPHLGFAITPPIGRTVLGQNLQSTQAPIQIYVDGANGNNANTGLSMLTAKLTLMAALATLPPVIRHPCSIIIRRGTPLFLQQVRSQLSVIALGDGDIRFAKQYALGNLSRVMQDEGRLVISRELTATDVVVIDATNFIGFGDGPTSAFYIDTGRVIFNGIKFQGFVDPVLSAYNSDVDFVDCEWENNVQAGAYVGCDSVILDRGSLSLPTSGTGHVLSQSNLTVSSHALKVPTGVSPQSAFFVGTRNSTITLKQHSQSGESGVSAVIVVATAQLNSSITADDSFQSAGCAVLGTNSVLLKTVAEPFAGGVTIDSSSTVVTQVI